MIVRDFYAPRSSYNEFTSTGKIGSLATSDYPSLLDKTVDPVKAYYMGETPADRTLFNYEYEVDDTDEHNLVFKSESLHVKPKWLYAFASGSDYDAAVAWDGTRWMGSAILINSMYAYYYNQFKTVTVNFALLVKNDSVSSLVNTGIVYRCHISTSSQTLQFTTTELFDFFENGAVKYIVIDGHGISFSMSDWSEDGWFFDVGNDMRLYVRSVDVTTINEHTGHYYPDAGMKFFSLQTIGTADANNNKIGCIYGQSCNYYTCPDIRLDFTSTFNLTTMSYTPDASTYTIISGDKWFGNVRPFEITQEACEYCRQQDISGSRTNNRLLLPDDTLLDYTGTSGSSYFVGINDGMCNFLGWYQTLFCVLPKIVTDKTASGTTVTPDTYSNVYNPYNAVPIFENNVPTGHLVKKGTYNELQPLLMNWQQYGMNVNDNEYDPDAPEPEPGGDTPGDEPQGLPHDDGIPPELQKNRTISVPALFITQYALTASELETVGLHLWTSWLTPNSDVHLNFFLPYAQDFGTLNIASCMDFIISLKVFPFEFPFDILLANNNGVRMGTGHTDFLGSATTYIKTQIYCLSAGECEVTLPEPYNDFRDIYNCTALCFMPYCGSVELNLAEILGRTLKASYFIDFQSGGCTCVIECAGDAGDYVIASKTGQIGFTLPMTATNAGQLAAQFMGDATKALGTISGFFFDSFKTVGNNLTSALSAQLGKKTGISENGEVSLLSGNTFETNTKLGQGAVNTGLTLANQAIDMLSRSGVDMPMLSGGGSAEAFMFADCVSIQIRRGKYKKPDNYPHSVGYYNLSSSTIESYKGAYSGSPSTGSTTGKGFCVFTNVDMTGLDCRQDEIDEILQLLSSGIYL